MTTTAVCPYCQFRVGHAVYCLHFVAPESTQSHLDAPPRASDIKTGTRACLDESMALLARSVELLTRYVGLLAEAQKAAQGFASPIYLTPEQRKRSQDEINQARASLVESLAQGQTGKADKPSIEKGFKKAVRPKRTEFNVSAVDQACATIFDISLDDVKDVEAGPWQRVEQAMHEYAGSLENAATPQPAKNCEKQTDYGTMAFSGVKRGSVTNGEVKDAVILVKAFMDHGHDGDTAMRSALEAFANLRGIL